VAEAEQRVRELAAWHVFAPTAYDVIEAIALQRQAKLSFWDAMIIHSAAESGCDVCWTEDLAEGQRLRGVRLRNPFTSR
jgi:predicted nucleic acid-binding protein